MILNNKQITMMESKKYIALFYFICTAHIRLNNHATVFFRLQTQMPTLLRK